MLQNIALSVTDFNTFNVRLMAKASTFPIFKYWYGFP